MSWGTLRTVLVFLTLIVLHYTLRPFLGWRVPIDFLVLALLFAAVRVRPGAAALIGFGLGLVADALALGALGASAFAMAVIGYLAAWLKAVFFADNLALNAFFFFAGKWMFDLLYLAIERPQSGVQLAQQLFLWSPLAAALTAVAGLIVVVVLRPVLERAPA